MTVRVEVYQKADNKLLSAKTHETHNVEQVLTYWRENCDGVNLYLLLSIVEDEEVVKQYCSDPKFLPKKRVVPRPKGFDSENKRAVFSLEEITEAGYERVIFPLPEGEFFALNISGNLLGVFATVAEAEAFRDAHRHETFTKTVSFIVDRDSIIHTFNGGRYVLFRGANRQTIHLKVSGKGYKVV